MRTTVMSLLLIAHRNQLMMRGIVLLRVVRLNQRLLVHLRKHKVLGRHVLGVRGGAIVAWGLHLGDTSSVALQEPGGGAVLDAATSLRLDVIDVEGLPSSSSVAS